MSVAQDVVHGAWVRRSASVSGSAHFETQHVIWLQAATCYADIRVPFHAGVESRCFSGQSGWDADGYRWTRHLDMEPVGGDDVGKLTWEDDALIERGLFPTPQGEVPYVEVWVRLPGGDGPFLAMEDRQSCLVRVGDHAITVVDGRPDGGSFSAAYRVLGPSGWSLIHAIGDGARLPDPADLPDWPIMHRGTTEVSA